MTVVYAIQDDWILYRVTENGVLGSWEKEEYVTENDRSIKEWADEICQDESQCFYVDADRLSEGLLPWLDTVSEIDAIETVDISKHELFPQLLDDLKKYGRDYY